MKYLLTLSFIIVSHLAYSQQKSSPAIISLADVAKIELNLSSVSNEKYEVTLGNDGLWSCWQTIYSEYDNSRYAQRDDKPRFVKTVPAAMLREMLEYFNRPDTSRNIAWFDLKHDELISELDSLKNTYFTADQRSTFVNGLANPDSLTSSMNRILRNEFMFSDGPLYRIELVMKKGQKILAQSNYGVILHGLPWKIGGYSLYNPGISRLFNTVIGKEKQNQNIRRSYQHRIVFDMFLKSYRTTFHWRNFVMAYPGAVSSAGPHVRPWRFIRNEEHYQGYFTSVQLPENWIIWIGFNQPDSAMLRLRKVEQMLARLYKKNKSGFDTLRVTPGGTVFFRLVGYKYEGIGGDEKERLKTLSASHPEIQNADLGTLIYINVVPRPSVTRSEHLLLPDGKLILVHQK
jgi:hypothetical protein